MERIAAPLRFSVDRAGNGRLAASWRFAGAIWVAIATILFCALAPTGLPQSTLFGSAFNPSTTTVALKARFDGPHLAIKRIARSDDDARGGDARPVEALAGAGAPAQLPVRLALRSAAPPREGDFQLATSTALDRPWPTGPPIA